MGQNAIMRSRERRSRNATKELFPQLTPHARHDQFDDNVTGNSPPSGVAKIITPYDLQIASSLALPEVYQYRDRLTEESVPYGEVDNADSYHHQAAPPVAQGDSHQYENRVTRGDQPSRGPNNLSPFLSYRGDHNWIGIGHRSANMSSSGTAKRERENAFANGKAVHRSDNRGDGEVTRMGAGESYRPSARRDQSPRRDRSVRRDHARTPPPSSDSYYPRDRSPRRRSRTPPYRRERTPPRDISNWRARARSPPRERSPRARSPPRRYSPRRDEDRRERRRSRSPRRRSRSPYDRDRPARVRSPLPPPRDSRRARSRSLDRRGDRTVSGPNASSWRHVRSPSPVTRESERSSGRTSASTSRRSSPPIHPSRVPLQPASREDRSRPRSPESVDRSPPTQQTTIPYRESAKSTPIERSPAPPRPAALRSPPRGPASFRAPTGPGAGRGFAASASVSAHNRPENSILVPPTGPRAQARGGSNYMRGGRGSFNTSLRPETSSWGAAPPSHSIIPDVSPRVPAVRATPIASPTTSAPTGPTGIPTGPRAGTAIPSRPSLQASSSYYSRTQQSSSAPPQPRVHPAIANLPQIIPGGKIDPTASGMSQEVEARLKKRREEEEVLREDLKQKQEKLRKGLKQWDKLSRESASMALKSELSERHVRALAGEGVGGAAF